MIVFVAAQTAHNGDPEKIAGIFTGLITAAAMLQGFLSYMARSMGNLAEQSGVLRDLATLFTTESTQERSVSDTTAQHQDALSPAAEAGEMTVTIERSLVPVSTRSDADAQGNYRENRPRRNRCTRREKRRRKNDTREYIAGFVRPR